MEKLDTRRTFIIYELEHRFFRRERRNLFRSESRFTGLVVTESIYAKHVCTYVHAARRGPETSLFESHEVPCFYEDFYAQATIFVSLRHVTLAAIPRYVLIFCSCLAANFAKRLSRF